MRKQDRKLEQLQNKNNINKRLPQKMRQNFEIIIFET